MARTDLKFADPEMYEIGPASQWDPQIDANLKISTGAAVISADDHCEVTRNIFKDSFPDWLKNRAPDVWFDKFWRIGYKGELKNWTLGKNSSAQQNCRRPPVWQINRRNLSTWTLRVLGGRIWMSRPLRLSGPFAEF